MSKYDNIIANMTPLPGGIYAIDTTLFSSDYDIKTFLEEWKNTNQVIYKHKNDFDMSIVNKVQLIGNVGNDPDVKYLDSGKVVANFPFATNESYMNKQNEKVTETEWHNIVMWGNLAKMAEKHIIKGMQLAVEGKIKTRSWEDDKGETRYKTEIIVSELKMLSKAPSKDQSAEKTVEDNPF